MCMSRSHTTVIRLQPRDAERYAALRREMLVDSPWAFAASLEDDRGVNPALMRESLAGAEYAVVAVESPDDRERLLAVAGVLREVKIKRRHIALIWGVYVTPSARGTGLGRAVVDAAVRTAKEWSGLTHVQLCVSESVPPPAKSTPRRLYESLGFEAWGTEPAAMNVNGRLYGDTHMVLRL